MNNMPKSVTHENCGDILRKIRQMFGSMSVAELAKILGVSRSTVMRIEAGQTYPSDELLNRLKALQIIGISKFRTLSEKGKDRFSQLIEEIGEDPEMFSKTISSRMVKELTPFGILAGIGAIAGASLIISKSVVSSIPILSSLAGYGLVKGLKAILQANGLECTENDGRWEITKTTSSKGTGPEKEVKEMTEKKENEEKNGGLNFDIGLGGLFKGLGSLIDSATTLAEKGEELSKKGEINFSGLDNIKGLKDLKGVYGVRVRTMADGKPSVQPFGNIKRTPKGPVVEEVREPIVDTFEEAQKIHIVAEMPGVDEKDIKLEINGDILNIAAEGKNRRYQKEVLLSRKCKSEDMTWSYKNGILEIKIAVAGD